MTRAAIAALFASGLLLRQDIGRPQNRLACAIPGIDHDASVSISRDRILT